MLARENIVVGGVVVRIEGELCSGCRGCINVCPYAAITFNAEKNIAEVNQALCKGCGACASVCPTGAMTAMHFTDEQVTAMVRAALAMELLTEDAL